MGGLNEIQNQNEKLGGAIPSQNRFIILSQFKNINNLIDLQTIGNEFTWRKRKTGSNNTFEKLDRVLVSDQITQWMPGLVTKNHAFSSSEHCQISVDLKENNNWRPQPFKFEILWTKRKYFEDIVKQAWRSNFEGNPMFNLTKKTILLKKNAKLWCKHTFGNIFKQLREVEEELIKIQSVRSRITNNNVDLKENRLLAKQRQLLSFHRHYWRQKAKNKHLNSMDFNSSYFHKVA